MNLIYLDHNATTPLAPEVKAAMLESLEVFGNPSSGHPAGAQALDLVRQARHRVARFLNSSRRRSSSLLRAAKLTAWPCKEWPGSAGSRPVT